MLCESTPLVKEWAPGQLHPNLPRVDKPEVRSFYEIEALKNNWPASEREHHIQ